ncbi:MAG: arylsulfatase [Fuerstiella sp.]|nr:arylsulfatase [Fuerstiella sp.]
MNKSCLTLAAIVVLLMPLSSLSLAAGQKLPHVVVIMVDDMGYGDPGFYNPDSKIATPNIDSLARDGMRFTDAHAPGPLCHMSRYGLMTGRYPFRADVGSWRRKRSIDAGQVTIASMLQDAGYQTAMVGKWHLGFDENGYDKPLPGGPIDCGFQSYFGIRASTDIPPYFYIRGDKAVQPPSNQIAANYSDGWTKIQGAFWREGGIAPDLALKDVLPRFTEEAVQVIQSHGRRPNASGKPLMLYLAYPAPHTPWLPSAEYAGRSAAGMYGDFATMVDANVGRVLRSLDDAGMAKDTLLVFTSDNGPVWYESDVERFGHDSSGGLRGMKADAWECGHRMPFIVRWPGSVAAGSTSHQTVCFTDLLATFSDVVGASLSGDAGPDSFSFFDVLKGSQADDVAVRQHLVMRSGGGVMTIRFKDWKLIQGLGSGGFSKPSRIKPAKGEAPGQLYNLKADPAEEHDVYASHPELVAEMTAKLEAVKNAKGQRFAK